MAVPSKKVFVTAGVFFAFLDRNHPKHREAGAFFRYFAKEKFQVITSIQMVVKTYNQLREHMSYSAAKDFVRSIYLGNIEILRPGEEEEKAALKLLFSDQYFDFPLEQAIINVLADRHNIPQVCSFEYIRFYLDVNPFLLPYQNL